MIRLLLISNSTNAGEEYLGHSLPKIKNFLGDFQPENAIFIPYAAVLFSFDEYEEMVNRRLSLINVKVTSIHHFDNPASAVEKADLIVVGGGNTFQLLKLLQENGLIEIVKRKVSEGVSYIGWSAGSNVACPTIKTTNDMPIVEPQSFNAFSLVHFQINPHYIDANPEGHAGETRDQRIMEFVEVNRNVYVVGLREGTALEVIGQKIKLIGDRPARIFHYGQTPQELTANDDFSFLWMDF